MVAVDYAKHILLAFNIKVEEMDIPLCRLALFLDPRFKDVANAHGLFAVLPRLSLS